MASPVTFAEKLQRLSAWWDRMEKGGLTFDDLQVPIDDAAMRSRLIVHWRLCAHTSSLERVSDTKSQCPVYDARAVKKLFSIFYTGQKLSAIGPPDALPGFLTFFDPGWSILHLRRFCADKSRIFYSQDWYDDEPFAKRTDEPCYRQIRMEALEGSFNMNFDEQWRLLPEAEEIPSARAVVTGMVIHFLLSGQRLFEKCHVRCSDNGSGGIRVCVGRFDRDGLDVYGGWDDNTDSAIGLASSRKF